MECWHSPYLRYWYYFFRNYNKQLGLLIFCRAQWRVWYFDTAPKQTQMPLILELLNFQETVDPQVANIATPSSAANFIYELISNTMKNVLCLTVIGLSLLWREHQVLKIVIISFVIYLSLSTWIYSHPFGKNYLIQNQLIILAVNHSV